MKCGQCKKELHPADVDTVALAARCRHCGWTFGRVTSPFREAVTSGETTDIERDRRRRIPTPRSVEVHEDGAQLSITFGAARHVHMVEAYYRFVATFFFGFVAIFASAVRGDLALVALFFACAALIQAFMKIFGRVRIDADAGELEVHSKNARKIVQPTATIDQLFVQEHVVARIFKRVRNDAYDLRARLDDGSEVTLVRNLREPVVALFLEQELERHLGIVNAAVDGEYQEREPIEIGQSSKSTNTRDAVE